jgi:hypothetical protein
VSEEPDIESQTGGAKNTKKTKKSVVKKGKGRKQRGGAMTEDQQTALYKAYQESQSSNKFSQNATVYDSFIGTLLTNLGVELTDQNKQEAKLVIDLKKAQSLPNNRTNKSTMINSARKAYNTFLNPLLSGVVGTNASSGVGSNMMTPQLGVVGTNASSGVGSNMMTSQIEGVGTNSIFNGGKSKSSSKKPKSSTKRPKPRKPKDVNKL